MFGKGSASVSCSGPDRVITYTFKYYLHDRYLWDGSWGWSFDGITDTHNRFLHETGYAKEYLVKGVKISAEATLKFPNDPWCKKKCP